MWIHNAEQEPSAYATCIARLAAIGSAQPSRGSAAVHPLNSLLWSHHPHRGGATRPSSRTAFAHERRKPEEIEDGAAALARARDEYERARDRDRRDRASRAAVHTGGRAEHRGEAAGLTPARVFAADNSAEGLVRLVCRSQVIELGHVHVRPTRRYAVRRQLTVG